MGLCGLVVLARPVSNHLYPLCTDGSLAHSQETSTTTLSFRFSPASAMNSDVMNLGIGVER
jgi:hypothetical protein